MSRFLEGTYSNNINMSHGSILPANFVPAMDLANTTEASSEVQNS
jgi:hypothetical protein